MASARRNARIEITAQNKTAAGINDAKNALRMFNRDTERMVAGNARMASRLAQQKERDAKRAPDRISGFAMGVGASVGQSALGFLADGAHDVLAFEAGLTRLQISGQMTTDQVAAFRAEVLKASAATGASANEILAGASSLVEFTGDAKTAKDAIGLIAEAMQAEGVSAQDLGGVLATLGANIKLDPSQYRAALDIIASGAHAGSIEMKDLASNLTQPLALYASLFQGGQTLGGLTQVTAMAQVLNNMTHSADLTGTYLKDAFLDIGKDAKNLRKFKIEPYVDPKAKNPILKDAATLLGEIHDKVGSSQDALHKIFPDMRGEGAIKYLLDNYTEVQHVAAETANSNQIAKDYAIQHASAAAKIAQGWNAAKMSIMDALSPDRVDRFASAMEGAGRASAWAIGKGATVLDWADKAGKGAATLIGGQTEEDRIANVRGHRYLERVDANLQRYDEAHVNENDGSDEYRDKREKAALIDTKREDMLRNRLFAQGAGVNWATADDPTNQYGAGSRSQKQNYSLSELVGLTGLVSQSSDSAMTQRAFAEALTKAIQDAFAGVQIKMDGNAVGKGIANAPGGATRPGRH